MRSLEYSCVVVAMALAALVAGCTGDGQNAPNSIAGLYAWTIESFDCSVPDGLLNAIDEVPFQQEGQRVFGSFVDDEGNSVTVEAVWAGGALTGTMTLTAPDGRRIVSEFRYLWGWMPEPGGGARGMLDGPVTVTADSANLCVGATADAWLSEFQFEQDEVFEDCGAVDIVFTMDTSGSMDDEADALCEQLEGVFSDLAALGLDDVRVFIWGITEDADAPEHQDAGEFTCLTDNVREVFNDAIVPGTVDRRIFLPDQEGDEDWGPSTAILAHFGSGGRDPDFQWRPDAIKIIVPISDEGPSQGDDGTPEENAEMIARAIDAANANGIIVSPIVGSGAEPPVAHWALELAQGTGGVAVRSADPSLDIAALINEIVFEACGGTVPGPVPPSDPGATILVAAERNGGLFSLDATTGSQTPLLLQNLSEVTHISSAVFNEKLDRFWVGTGDNSNLDGSIVSIAADGTTVLVADNDVIINAHPGLAQNRWDRIIVGMEGDDDDLYVINNMTGVAVEIAHNVADTADSGNAVTYVGQQLYLAAGQTLYRVDGFTGAATVVAQLTLQGDGASGIEAFNIGSMTTRPSDDKVFCVVKDKSDGLIATWFASIDVTNGNVQLIAENQGLLDGLAWVPAGYFLAAAPID